MKSENPLSRRSAGVLLHVTALPNRWSNGDFGSDAFRFVDFLSSCGQSIWQVLPIGPVHEDLSPYQSLSSFAISSQLVGLDDLVRRRWVSAEELDRIFSDKKVAAFQKRPHVLKVAFERFKNYANEKDRSLLQAFEEKEQDWLGGYVAYEVFRKHFDRQSWNLWPDQFKYFDENTIEECRRAHGDEFDQIVFEQFVLDQQWHRLKSYANKKGVLLYGDMPIFVAYDSADVWSHQNLFKLDESGEPTVIAGVPPDYFSETGQRWGNPHYLWQQHQQDNFLWWRKRVNRQLSQFDILRIDHFRGFESSWEINPDQPHAIHGKWIAAPGEALFSAMLGEHESNLPLVAEDLGVITQQVTDLRNQFEFPGMKILHFAFDGDPNNPYLLSNHETNTVVYTGTHDNDTTLGWYDSLDDESKERVDQFVGIFDGDMPWSLMTAAYSSIGNTVIVPMQDLLCLGNEARMNVPGEVGGNWAWQLQWEQIEPGLADRLLQLTKQFDRDYIAADNNVLTA